MEKGNKVTEVELVYRNKNKASERPPVETAREAYNLLLKSWHKGKIESQEEFKILLLDNQSRCLGVSTLASGSLTGCEIDIKLIFATALKTRASKIILAHNHPSGHLEPSYEDKVFTNKCKDAGQVLSLEIVDHLVVTKEDFFSFEAQQIL